MKTDGVPRRHPRLPEAYPPCSDAGSAALLLLADGRFPAGSHAHSSGLEAAAAAGRVTDAASLGAFLRGRVTTSGLTAAAFAAAACARAARAHREQNTEQDTEQSAEQGTGQGTEGDKGTNGVRGEQGESEATRFSPGLRSALQDLEVEFSARTPSPALRAASRRLGRQLLRAARAVFPHPLVEECAASCPQGPHQPVALGVCAHTLGLRPRQAATAALHDAATGPATAAVRLLGLDPFAVHAVLARLAPELDGLARTAADGARGPARALPAAGSPLLDVSAEIHATWEVRLFAS